MFEFRRSKPASSVHLQRGDVREQRRIVLVLLAAVVLVDQAVKWWAWRHAPGARINAGGDLFVIAGTVLFTVSLSHLLRLNRSRRIATGSGTTAIRRRLRIRTGLGATAAAILLIVAAGIGATRNGGRTEPKTTTAAQEIRID